MRQALNIFLVCAFLTLGLVGELVVANDLEVEQLERGEILNQEDLYQPVDPAVQDALDTTADLLVSFGRIIAENQEFAYDDFRSNRLEPAIRRMSEVAKASGNKEVMYSAIALASCDFDSASRGAFWSAKVSDALRAFSHNDIQDIFSRLPDDGMTRVRDRILKDMELADPLAESLTKVRASNLGVDEGHP